MAKDSEDDDFQKKFDQRLEENKPRVLQIAKQFNSTLDNPAFSEQLRTNLKILSKFHPFAKGAGMGGPLHPGVDPKHADYDPNYVLSDEDYTSIWQNPSLKVAQTIGLLRPDLGREWIQFLTGETPDSKKDSRELGVEYAGRVLEAIKKIDLSAAATAASKPAAKPPTK